MLIDFCNSVVKSQITCNKVSFDGYEVTNLVSDDKELKNRGFLSEAFIKLPLHITVQFPCNIVISKIIIDPVIGQQQSCDVKLFTASELVAESWLYGKESAQVHTDGAVFNFVGNVSKTELGIICFENNFFQERNMWRLDSLDDVSKYSCEAKLISRKPGGLSNVSHVTVCVMRTKGNKAVAVKRLEIWGIPSCSVPYDAQVKLKKIYSDYIQHSQKSKSLDMFSSQLEAPVVGILEKMEPVLHDGVYIPEDFLDQITFELMSMPVLLPSGKIIDQLTLEKCVHIESSWGRPPSDPFTGVAFTKGSQPTTNLALKSRIDQFVIKNAHSLKTPRTLGYGHNKDKCMPSRLVHHLADSQCEGSRDGNNLMFSNIGQSKQIEEKSEIFYKEFEKNVCGFVKCSSKKSAESCPDGIVLGNVISRKRKLMDTIPELTDPFSIHSKQHTLDSISTKNIAKLNVSPLGTVVALGPQYSLTSDHKVSLSNSLDNALFSILGSLPSFTKKCSSSKKSETVSLSLQQFQCCRCKVDLANKDLVKYKMPCNHHICRHCLQTNGSGLYCDICCASVSLSQLERVF